MQGFDVPSDTDLANLAEVDNHKVPAYLAALGRLAAGIFPELATARGDYLAGEAKAQGRGDEWEAAVAGLLVQFDLTQRFIVAREVLGYDFAGEPFPDDADIARLCGVEVSEVTRELATMFGPPPVLPQQDAHQNELNELFEGTPAWMRWVSGMAELKTALDARTFGWNEFAAGREMLQTLLSQGKIASAGEVGSAAGLPGGERTVQRFCKAVRNAELEVFRGTLHPLGGRPGG
jgi:hypothetical protein